MRSNRFLSLLVLLPPILLVACAAPSATAVPPAPTEVSIQATATFPPSATPAPTRTPLPSETPAPTQTLPPTATLPPTPDPALSNIKLIGLAWYNNYDLLLSFEFTEPVDPEKYRVTLEEKEYDCEVLAEFPNRLYCRGQGAKVLAVATVRVYPAGLDVPGFEKDVWVPYFP